MDRRTLSVLCGLVGPLCALLGVALAAILHPEFSLWHGSLSHLGERPPGTSLSLGLLVDQPSFFLFNGGLLLGGALGMVFAWLLYDDARYPSQRSGATALTIAFLGLLALGAFPQPSAFNAPAAIATVLATTTFCWIYGAGTMQAGEQLFGGLTALSGLGLVGLWIAWDAWITDAGMAVPEFAVVALLAGWTIVAAARKFETTDGRTVVAALRQSVGDRGRRSAE